MTRARAIVIAGAPNPMKFAVQMYSLRHHIQTGDDLLEVLGKVKEIGFDGVEFAGYFGLDAETIKARLDELGLVCMGAHVGIPHYDEPQLAETIRFHKVLGCTQIGVGGANTSDEEGLEETMKILSHANEVANKEGMKIYFHNHGREFLTTEDDTSGGKMIIDRLKEACYLQVDTYWSFHAGMDNYKFLTENKDRIVAIHIKDGIDGKPKALGEGNCDLASVIKAAKDIGLSFMVLENDDPQPTGLEDIARSMAYLKANV